MIGPQISRDGDGKIRRHWTTESAEAAARAERARRAEKIRAERVIRPGRAERAVEFVAAIGVEAWRVARAALRLGRRRTHPERI